MKLILCFSVALLLIHLDSSAQVIDPVKWRISASKAGQGVYDIQLIATIESPWHIYSQFLPPGGPLPTKISFLKNPLVTLVGKPTEKGRAVKEHEDVFNMDVVYFPGYVVFGQRVKSVSPKIKTNLQCSVAYMVCKDGQCLPISEKKFQVTLGQ